MLKRNKNVVAAFLFGVSAMGFVSGKMMEKNAKAYGRLLEKAQLNHRVLMAFIDHPEMDKAIASEIMEDFAFDIVTLGFDD